MGTHYATKVRVKRVENRNIIASGLVLISTRCHNSLDQIVCDWFYVLLQKEPTLPGGTYCLHHQGEEISEL
jgi:hypothetical protein